MNDPVSPRTLEEIQSKLNIVDIVQEHVALKKSGRNFKALCPFHEEKTPSFTVNAEKQVFHCFGCGVGGNVFTFISKVENVPFPEAVRIAAERAGVAVASLPGRDDGARKRIVAANEFAARAYAELLAAPAGRRAVEYLSGRNVTGETAADFGLGYAPWEPTFLSERAAQAGVPAADLAAAGLVSGETGRDFFRHRLLFPIRDARGAIVGFGGRSLEETQVPKYLNTGETAAFNKSWVLFGLDRARSAVVSSGYAIAVEGYFDVLRLT